MAALTATLIWPNGRGETPCSEAYLAAHDQAQQIKPDHVSMDELSAADYQRWNELDHALLSMQGSGEHLGKSIAYHGDGNF